MQGNFEIQTFFTYLWSLQATIKGMSKKTVKTKRRDIIKAARVRKTADLTGVSQRHVQRVIEGSRMNDNVLTVFMKIEEGENQLLEAVKNLVPLTN